MIAEPEQPTAGAQAGLQAVVFDLDGVIIDSEGAWDDARRRVTAQAGGRWREEATTAMMGMSAPEWARYMRRQLGVRLPEAEISSRVVALLLASYRVHLPLLPGAAAAVRRLAAAWPLAIASSANRQVIDAVLAASGLARCFAATVASEEAGRGKPAPDVYLAAAARLEVQPARTAVVEDSANGLRAGAAAGMRVIAVPNRRFPPPPDALALADLTVASLEQLTPAAVAALGAGPPRR